MMPGGGYHSFFEQVVAFASSTDFENEIRDARSEFFADTGEIREEEKGFEARSEAFTEWYVLERIVTSANRTPLEMFLIAKRAGLGADEISTYEGFRHSFRGLFEFIKVNKERLIVRDLASNSKLGVSEKRVAIGTAKGTILDARVIHFCGEQVLTRSVLYHPLSVRELILEQVKLLKGQERRAYLDFMRKLSIARFRCDRYQRVNAERLYQQVLGVTSPAARTTG
jgi:hypothetical protein